MKKINKKGQLFILLLVSFMVLVLPIIFVNAFALNEKKVQVESLLTPEVKRSGPILDTVSPVLKMISRTATIEQVSAPNIVPNSSLELASSASVPTNWSKGGYGVNNRVFSYPVTGYNSAKAIKVENTSYTSGDSKWYFSDVPVISGHTYKFSDYYISNISSIVDVRFKLADGTYIYKDIVSAPTASSFQYISAEFAAPADAVSMTVFHIIKGVGFLITDEYSITDTSVVITPPDPDNLIPNPDFEQGVAGAFPTNWLRGRWGTNTTSFTYPTASGDGSRAVSLSITNYTSGDAKWYFNPISIPSGDYTYSDQYISDQTTYLTVQYQKVDGTYSYKDIATLPATSNYTKATGSFNVPSGTKAITVFHLIKKVGFLTIDNTTLTLKSLPTGIFSTGAVTFRFDDGWLSQYTNAIPKLKTAGFSATLLIATDQMYDDGYTGFMSESQVAELYDQGFEIGAHTRTHPYLTSLSSEEQQDEIAGSKQDIIDMIGSSATTLAYPFGDYDSDIIQIVKNAGYKAALATIDGYVTPASDKFQLERMPVNSNTTLSQVKNWVDSALLNKKWLILSMHEINDSGSLYSTKPSTFNQIVDYVKSTKIPVVTVEQGIKSM
jgi:peptidoglycan/xylan/chitin deacetylase (PgdA/CDA1 family)